MIKHKMMKNMLDLGLLLTLGGVPNASAQEVTSEMIKGLASKLPAGEYNGLANNSNGNNNQKVPCKVNVLTGSHDDAYSVSVTPVVSHGELEVSYFLVTQGSNVQLDQGVFRTDDGHSSSFFSLKKSGPYRGKLNIKVSMKVGDNQSSAACLIRFPKPKKK